MTYYVDRTNNDLAYACRGQCSKHFKPFDTLKAATKYAGKNGYSTILDDNGDLVQPWKSRQQLEEYLTAAQAEIERQQDIARKHAERTAEKREEEQKAAEEQEARMLAAGYIPLETLRNMLGRDISASDRGPFLEYQISVMVRHDNARQANIFNALVKGRP